MPSQHESIREACDHCHNKKLRCERVQGSNGCRRCTQNSLTCVYSPRHLSGTRASRKRPRSDILDLATRSGNDHGIQGQACPINAVSVGAAAACADAGASFHPVDRQLSSRPVDEWSFDGSDLINGNFEEISPLRQSQLEQERSQLADCGPRSINSDISSLTYCPLTTATHSTHGQSATSGITAADNAVSYQPSSHSFAKDKAATILTTPDVLPNQTAVRSISSHGSTPIEPSSLQTLSDLNVKIHEHAKTLPCLESNIQNTTSTDGASLHTWGRQLPLTSTSSFQRTSTSIFAIDDTLRYTYSLVQTLNDFIPKASNLSCNQSLSQSQHPTRISSPTFLSGSEDRFPLPVQIPDLDDSIMLIILSCCLRLIKIYDHFFSNATQHLTSLSPLHAHTTDTPIGLPSPRLPNLSIGSFPLPITFSPFLQTRFTLETVADMYIQLRNVLSRLGTLISASCHGGDGSSCGSSLITKTTFELVLSRERSTGEKMGSVKRLCGERAVQDRLEAVIQRSNTGLA